MGYLDLSASFAYREPLFRAKLDALAENDAYLKSNGWAESTKAVFYQASVPSGWTKDTSQNDKALRVVGNIGGGGSGGSQALSSNITLAHTHAIVSDDSHTHSYPNHTHFFDTPGGGGFPPFSYIYINNGGFIRRYTNLVSGTSRTILKAEMDTPGDITLGTLAAHSHGGVSDSKLADFIFAYCDILVGAKNAPAGTYTDLTNYWETGSKMDFDPLDQSADNDAYNYANLMPAGTVMIFGQASPSTGWTKLTTVTDRMLRVVNGTGAGTGGSQLISSGVTLAHIHTLTTEVDHTHSTPAHQHQIASSGGAGFGDPVGVTASYVQADFAGRLLRASDSGSLGSRTAYKTQSTNGASTSTSSTGSHTHVVPSALTDFTLAYVDVIQCSKDTTGAPYTYQDLTSTFVFKRLVSKQRLNNLGKNDAHVYYHTTPINTKTFFFMASPPVGWSQITTHHDKALRMVSGGTGGSPGGGSQLLSSEITLAHTHTITAAGGHTHTGLHTHDLDSASQSQFEGSATFVMGLGTHAGTMPTASDPTGSPGFGIGGFILKSTSNVPNEDPATQADHDHDGVTDSKLSNVSLAYADVIWCVKS